MDNCDAKIAQNAKQTLTNRLPSTKLHSSACHVDVTLAVSSLILRFLTVIRLLESKFCPGMSMSSAYLSSSSSSLLCSRSCGSGGKKKRV